MGDYYHLGDRREGAHHPVRQFLVVFGVIIIVAALVGGYLVRHSETTITNAPAVTHPMVAVPSSKKLFDEGTFSFSVDSSWALDTVEHRTYTAYHFHSSKSHREPRTAVIYVDGAPSNMAINRSMPLHPQGDRVSLGTMSGNCGELLTPPVMNSQQAAGRTPIAATWQQVQFICDIGNYSKGVVGTGTLGESLNRTTLQGPHSGRHSFFFVYTDASADPHYEDLSDMLTSFRVK